MVSVDRDLPLIPAVVFSLFVFFTTGDDEKSFESELPQGVSVRV